MRTNTKQRYAIQVNGDIVYHDLSRREAEQTAKQEAAKQQQVFVTWFRSSDGQHGYLNRDGNHAITGTAW